MDTFGFTKKKLTSLSQKNQNQHIINWLSGFYQKLTTNRVNPAALDFFTCQYNEILDWAEMKPFVKPGSDNTRLWIETVSDRIHYHRLAAGITVRDHDLFEKIQTDDSIVSTRNTTFDCHLALDGLRSLFNVGSIFRTCEAAGFKSIICGSMPGKEHPNVKKTSMGTYRWVDQETTKDLAQTLIEKKKKGFEIIGVETIKDSRPFYDIQWKDKTIIVFGNEEYGISSHVLETCDKFVHIPMFGQKNAINVANAVSVICFHIAGSLTASKKE